VKLTDLEPQFIKWNGPGTRPHVADLASASGLYFLCPKCWNINGGPVGTHAIGVWFKDRGVPDTEIPGPGRWVPSGTGYDDLTLSPSINIAVGAGAATCCMGTPGWHGHIINGNVT
jgi:hypothetical protein